MEARVEEVVCCSEEKRKKEVVKKTFETPHHHPAWRKFRVKSCWAFVFVELLRRHTEQASDRPGQSKGSQQEKKKKNKDHCI